MAFWRKRRLDPQLEGDFPLLTIDHYRIKSLPHWIDRRLNRYNCIAYAAGDNSRWWWPDPYKQYYWPPNAISRDATVDCFVQTFGLLDYVEINKPLPQAVSQEQGLEKVTIYFDRFGSPPYTTPQMPTHAARQSSNGNWRSKLGPWDIIEHLSLDCLTGGYPAYGEPIKVLWRKKRTFLQKMSWFFNRDANLGHA